MALQEDCEEAPKPKKYNKPVVAVLGLPNSHTLFCHSTNQAVPKIYDYLVNYSSNKYGNKLFLHFISYRYGRLPNILLFKYRRHALEV